MTGFLFDYNSIYNYALFEVLLLFASLACLASYPIFAIVVVIVRWYHRRHDDAG